MASFIRLVYLIIVLSIAADFTSLFNTHRQVDDIIAAQSSSLILPGANAVIPGILGRAIIGAAAKAVSKSSKKAARKEEKRQERKKGNERNKAKKKRGKGM